MRESITHAEAVYGALPVPLSRALSRNTAAMCAFMQLSDEDRSRVIVQSRNIFSKSEMRAYVASLIK